MARCALEVDFPASAFSLNAEKESWRKEVHRPASHTHKWWAQRLGSVFRGILCAAQTSTASEALALYERGGAASYVVLDPFAGSGTTLVEAVKLGCRAAGLDINPVASLVQRQALAAWDEQKLRASFKEVEIRVRDELTNWYMNSTGETVLYYFWVATAPCPNCPAEAKEVELFSRFVFAQHAYVKKQPRAHATCPECHAITAVDLSRDDGFACARCGWSGAFDGPVKGRVMRCRNGHETKILDALAGRRPEYVLYAKLVLGRDGLKRYEEIDDYDLDQYQQCKELLAKLSDELPLPSGSLQNGYNTRQAMSWGFHCWRDFFNDRQLLSLGLLGRAVGELPLGPEREALITLFSGVLEFNNMFCSYKGEGTGAVRHMFSHHILKPERTPLEANPWGTSASSGSFMTLFDSRLIRALDYKEHPHDIVAGERKHGGSRPLLSGVTDDPKDFSAQTRRALVRTATGASTGLGEGTVDFVVTDPPYFDNVHYSELADFFHSWLSKLGPFESYPTGASSTRSIGEVQSRDAGAFSAAIEAVWAESARVMRRDGLLAFTFHHARPEGWEAVVKALRGAGLVVTSVQPIKGEMTVSAPKSGAKNPSNLDSIVVCRKAESAEVTPSVEQAVEMLRLLSNSGTAVGWSDVQSVVRGTVMSRFTFPENSTPLAELKVAAVEAGAEAARVLNCLEL